GDESLSRGREGPTATHHLRKSEWEVNRRPRPCKLKNPQNILLSPNSRPAVEFFILLVAAAEFRTEKIPDEPHQFDAGLCIGRARAHVALDIGGDIRVGKVGIR